MDARGGRVIRSQEDADLESRIKASPVKQPAQVGNPVVAVICRLRFEALLVCLIIMIALMSDTLVCGKTVVDWVQYGAGFCGAGCLAGTSFAYITGSTDFARVGCGSWSADCAKIWCRDVCKGILALCLSLFATCVVAGVVTGAIGIALFGATRAEYAFNFDMIPILVTTNGMWGVIAVLGIWGAVRFFFKTKDGWYIAGEELTDDDWGKDDWKALL